MSSPFCFIAFRFVSLHRRLQFHLRLLNDLAQVCRSMSATSPLWSVFLHSHSYFTRCKRTRSGILVFPLILIVPHRNAKSKCPTRARAASLISVWLETWWCCFLYFTGSSCAGCSDKAQISQPGENNSFLKIGPEQVESQFSLGSGPPPMGSPPQPGRPARVFIEKLLRFVPMQTRES
jgi:hypothetical protein